MLCLPCWPACCLDKVCSLHSLARTWPAAALPAELRLSTFSRTAIPKCLSTIPWVRFNNDTQEERLALDSTLPFLENVIELFLKGSPAPSPLGTSCLVAAACSCSMLVLSARTGSGVDRLRPIRCHCFSPTACLACYFAGATKSRYCSLRQVFTLKVESLMVSLCIAR